MAEGGEGRKKDHFRDVEEEQGEGLFVTLRNDGFVEVDFE